MQKLINTTGQSPPSGQLVIRVERKLRQPPGQETEQLTDDSGVFWSVKRADDDEAEAFVLLSVNNHITGLQSRSLWRRSGGRDGESSRACSRGGVATWRAVLRGH